MAICRALFAVALLVPLTVSARGGTVHSESSSQSTSAVTEADGTTTTTITEKVTRDGHTTTKTRTVVAGPGEAAPAAPPVPDLPPAPRRPQGDPPAEAPPASHQGPALAAESLAAHNRERRRLGVGDLSWDPQLAALADKWARHLCRGGKNPPPLQHRPPVAGGPGENLWEALTTESTQYAIDDAVKSWAGERKYYNQRSGQCQGGTCGHYTQLVWRATKQVGCGVATCPAGAFTATVWACNYAPAGNFVGERAY